MKSMSGLKDNLVGWCPRNDHQDPARSWNRFLFLMMSAAALAWFLVRVIPRPFRATYPCQQAAFPLLSSFFIWLLGLKASLLAWLGFRDRRAASSRLSAATPAAGLGIGKPLLTTSQETAPRSGRAAFSGLIVGGQRHSGRGGVGLDDDPQLRGVSGMVGGK